MAQESMSKPTVRVFGIGGAGFNIVADLLQRNHRRETDLLAQIKVSLIDTSKSNYHRNKELFDSNDIEPIFVPDVDGAGQNRAAIAKDVIPYITSIAYKAEPGDLNILIHSSNGGSGSTVSPLLARELISKGHNVLVIMVTDDSTAKYATNTAGTIRSYEAISREIDNPIICAHVSNNEQPLKEVNEDVISYIWDCCLLFSGNNHGIDTADLKNFFNFKSVTDIRSNLTLFTTHGIATDDEPTKLAEKIKKLHGQTGCNVIAVANINPLQLGRTQSIDAPYIIEGQADLSGMVDNPNEVYYVLTNNYYHSLLKEVDRKIEKYKQDSVLGVTVLEIDVGNTTQGGLVF